MEKLIVFSKTRYCRLDVLSNNFWDIIFRYCRYLMKSRNDFLRGHNRPIAAEVITILVPSERCLVAYKMSESHRLYRKIFFVVHFLSDSRWRLYV